MLWNLYGCTHALVHLRPIRGLLRRCGACREIRLLWTSKDSDTPRVLTLNLCLQLGSFECISVFLDCKKFSVEQPLCAQQNFLCFLRFVHLSKQFCVFAAGDLLLLMCWLFFIGRGSVLWLEGVPSACCPPLPQFLFFPFLLISRHC